MRLASGPMSSTGSTVGARIRAAREALGVSRSALAQRIGRTENAVYLYEDGSMVPSSPVLALFAHTLGVPLGDLIDDQVRAVDEGIARNLGEGPIVPPSRRATLVTLLSPTHPA